LREQQQGVKDRLEKLKESVIAGKMVLSGSRRAANYRPSVSHLSKEASNNDVYIVLAPGLLPRRLKKLFSWGMPNIVDGEQHGERCMSLDVQRFFKRD
jgi:hypothetical protein